MCAPNGLNEKIQRFIPGTDSGTFDYFVEAVFDEDEAPILSAKPQLSEDDNVLGTRHQPAAPTPSASSATLIMSRIKTR